ncbi:MAG: hypothetical protein DHS20C11_03590 [Lysobacteraceae bacterium]|nr:MAG: hypothetical protein DHS20C11_03590 [Xanthomonadaceae bacterium]
MKLTLITACWLLFAGPLLAQGSNAPGYVEFGDLGVLSSQPPKVEISLGASLLGFLSAATEEEDAELASTLSKLQSIRVNVFEVDAEKGDEAMQYILGVGNQLEQRGWERAVVVREEESVVHMYMMMVDGNVVGMAVMMAGGAGDDAVFMNIVGEIEPRQLGRVAAKFGVPLDFNPDS